MFGYGQEILLILVLAFFVFGPSEFPKVAKTIARALGELRRMGDEVRSTVESNLNISGLDGAQIPGDRRAISPHAAPSAVREIPDTLPGSLADPPFASSTERNGSDPLPSVQVTEPTNAAYWARRGSRLFHRGECMWAARTAERDRVYFETSDQARDQGGMSCPVCDA